MAGALAGLAAIVAPSVAYAKPPHDKDKGPPPGKGWRKNDITFNSIVQHAQATMLDASKHAVALIAMVHKQGVGADTVVQYSAARWSGLASSYSQLGTEWGKI